MARVEPLRVGLYARISTHDQQTLALQVKAMRQYARRLSWKVVKAVEDVGSGAGERPQREELIKAAILARSYRFASRTLDPGRRLCLLVRSA